MANNRLQLTLSAKGLPNLAGLLNTSDPFALVKVRGDAAYNPPVIAGETEVYVKIQAFPCPLLVTHLKSLQYRRSLSLTCALQCLQQLKSKLGNRYSLGRA